MRTFTAVLACLFLYGCSTPPPKEAPVVTIGNATAPDVYRVKLDTSKGTVLIEVTRAWAPLGADRFFNLVQGRFFDGDRFFRVLPTFVVQFGINGDPSVSQLWSNLTFADDAVKERNRRGTITFATRGKDTRTTQVFFNMKDNLSLDSQGFAPFGRVISGMDEVVDHLYFGYGEMAPRGPGPDPRQIQLLGNGYLEEKFPRLDYIKKASVEK